PQKHYAAATVDDFCTAALTRKYCVRRFARSCTIMLRLSGFCVGRSNFLSWLFYQLNHATSFVGEIGCQSETHCCGKKNDASTLCSIMRSGEVRSMRQRSTEPLHPYCSVSRATADSDFYQPRNLLGSFIHLDL
ncbi:hypothetical protein, partial [Agrobacterium pusense]|uniref:hypothetical protein n=1 Tax=Agrobacterium pusense TaxID=648995 RepID=UPI001AECFFF2